MYNANREHCHLYALVTKSIFDYTKLTNNQLQVQIINLNLYSNQSVFTLIWCQPSINIRKHMFGHVTYGDTGKNNMYKPKISFNLSV